MSTTSPGSSSQPKPSQGLDALTELAMNLRWTWNHSTDELWQRLIPNLWALTHPPSAMPQTIPLENRPILWQR